MFGVFQNAKLPVVASEHLAFISLWINEHLPVIILASVRDE